MFERFDDSEVIVSALDRQHCFSLKTPPIDTSVESCGISPIHPTKYESYLVEETIEDEMSQYSMYHEAIC